MRFSTDLPLYVKEPTLALRTDALRSYSKTMKEFAALEKRLGTSILHSDIVLLPSRHREYLFTLFAQVREKLDVVARMVDPTKDEALNRARAYTNVGLSALQQTKFSSIPEIKNFAVRPDRQLVEAEFFLHTPEAIQKSTAETLSLPTNLNIAVVMDDSSDLLRMESAHEEGRLFVGSALKTFRTGQELVHSMVADNFMPDVVLTNTMMVGRMGGYTLNALLRERNFDKTVIALEAEEETAQIARELFDQGFDGLISLPKHFTNPEKSGRAVRWEQRLNDALTNYNYYKNQNGWTH